MHETSSSTPTCGLQHLVAARSLVPVIVQFSQQQPTRKLIEDSLLASDFGLCCITTHANQTCLLQLCCLQVLPTTAVFLMPADKQSVVQGVAIE